MDCDSVLLSQPPLPSVQRHRRWERSGGEIRAVWADPGCSRTPGLAGMGSDAAAPQVARLLRAPRRIPAGVLLSRSFGFRAGGGRGSSRHPFRAGELFSACARRRLAGPGSPGSRLAGTPLATGSLGSLPRCFDVVLHVPPQFTSVCGAGSGRVYIWARGHVLLTAAFRLKFVLVLVGHFQLLLVNNF